jgi:hypothetical protein
MLASITEHNLVQLEAQPVCQLDILPVVIATQHQVLPQHAVQHCQEVVQNHGTVDYATGNGVGDL